MVLFCLGSPHASQIGHVFEAIEGAVPQSPEATGSNFKQEMVIILWVVLRAKCTSTYKRSISIFPFPGPYKLSQSKSVIVYVTVLGNMSCKSSSSSFPVANSSSELKLFMLNDLSWLRSPLVIFIKTSLAEFFFLFGGMPLKK